MAAILAALHMQRQASDLFGTPSGCPESDRLIDAIVQMVRNVFPSGHLLDVESMWMNRVDDYLAGRSELTAADLSNRKTHEANHNMRPLADILADFRKARLRLVDRVGEFQPEMFARAMLHPRLKQPMRLVDHLYFAAEHDDHHLAKIWELINER